MSLSKTFEIAMSSKMHLNLTIKGNIDEITA